MLSRTSLLLHVAVNALLSRHHDYSRDSGLLLHMSATDRCEYFLQESDSDKITLSSIPAPNNQSINQSWNITTQCASPSSPPSTFARLDCMLQLGIIDLNEWSNSSKPSSRCSVASLLPYKPYSQCASARQQSRSDVRKDVCLESCAVRYLFKPLLLFAEALDNWMFVFGAFCCSVGELIIIDCQPARGRSATTLRRFS